MLKHTLQFITLTCFLLVGTTSVAIDKKPDPIQVGGSVGSLNDRSITDAEIAFQVIFNELLSEVNESFNLKIYENQSKLFSKFKHGEIDAILTNSLNFIELHNLIHPTARYSVQFGDELKQNYLVLVRRSDNLTKLKQLREKVLSLGESHQVGKLFLDVELLQLGLPISDHFFKDIHRVNGDNTSIIDLYFGKIDAAVVPKYNFEIAQSLNPQIKNKLQILTESEPMIHQAVGLRYNFSQKRINNFEPSILTDMPNKRLRHVLDTFGIVRLHKINDETLSEVRSLKRQYNRLVDKKR
ncbi:MAG: PhnD/SsuA/transferrin family substrate-binding protein [Candidatus Thiodiazotropha sp. LLP2]